MPLPDPHEGEESADIPEELWREWERCTHNAEAWGKMANEAKAKIQAILGNATAALVGGAKVGTYRSSRGWASSQLCKDYPELTQHYVRDVVGQEFDVALFAKAHPEIADKYRIRSFRKVV